LIIFSLLLQIIVGLTYMYEKMLPVMDLMTIKIYPEI